MRKLLTLLTIATGIILNSFSVYGKEPEKNGMFREDRVWTYWSTQFIFQEREALDYIIKMKFEGTEEYEGKSYHRFINISQTMSKREWYNHYVFEDLQTTEPMLVREERGKIFARIPKGYFAVDPPSELTDEIQLYDFNCPVGGSFNSTDGFLESKEIKVTGESYITIGNERLRKIETSSTYTQTGADGAQYSDTWEVIENIGIVNGNGFFSFFNEGGLGIDHRWEPGFMIGAREGIYFVNITDLEGKVLYGKDEPALGYQQLLNSGNEWEYFSYRQDPENDRTYCQLSRYKWGGADLGYTYPEKFIYGTNLIYDKVVLDNVTSWTIPGLTTDFEQPGYDVKTETVGKHVASLRQEGGRVYILLPGETVEYTEVPYREVWTRPVEKYEEALLYDFSAQEGEVKECYVNILAPAKVKSAETVEYDVIGQVRKVNIVNDRPDPAWSEGNGPAVYIDATYVEGVGNIGRGNLIELVSDNPYQPTPADGYRSGEFFNNLYFRDHELLFPGLGIKAPETGGVGGVTDDTRNGEGIRYDLFGRRIREAGPGQIYIEKGRKRVGK